MVFGEGRLTQPPFSLVTPTVQLGSKSAYPPEKVGKQVWSVRPLPGNQANETKKNWPETKSNPEQNGNR
jgi:hypothetical protein